LCFSLQRPECDIHHRRTQRKRPTRKLKVPRLLIRSAPRNGCRARDDIVGESSHETAFESSPRARLKQVARRQRPECPKSEAPQITCHPERSRRTSEAGGRAKRILLRSRGTLRSADATGRHRVEDTLNHLSSRAQSRDLVFSLQRPERDIHGLRRGLHSCAASRLLPPWLNRGL
jgi:hypothetical protein